MEVWEVGVGICGDTDRDSVKDERLEEGLEGPAPLAAAEVEAVGVDDEDEENAAGTDRPAGGAGWRRDG